MEKIFALVKDNIVVNTVVFDENAAQEFIDEITSSTGASSAIDTSLYEDFGIGYTWHSDHFRPPQPYPSWTWENAKWNAPTPKPTDAFYEWDENSQSWIFIENFLPEEEL